MGIINSELHEVKKKNDDEWNYHNQVFAMIAIQNEINKNGNRLRNIFDKARQGKVAIRDVAYFVNINSTNHLIHGDLNIDLANFNPGLTDFITAFIVHDRCGNGLHFNFVIT